MAHRHRSRLWRSGAAARVRQHRRSIGVDRRRCARPSCSASLDIVPASRTVLIKLAGPRYQAPTRQRLGKLASDAPRRWRRPATPLDGRGRHRDRRGVRRRRPRRGRPAHRAEPPTRWSPRTPARLWRVGFGGFAPGFAYLVGGDERLNVPRRSEPRTKVPAGSVGAGRRVQRRLPAGITRRLAADRSHGRRRCGTSTATSPHC